MSKEAFLIILSSENGRDNWKVVLPADVPEWVKGEANMAKLVEGYTCMKCDEGIKGSLHYRAVHASRKMKRSTAQDIENLIRAADRRVARALKKAVPASSSLN